MCDVAQRQDRCCAEDCGYCSQSAHYEPGKVKSQLIGLDEVKKAAKERALLAPTVYALEPLGVPFEMIKIYKMSKP